MIKDFSRRLDRFYRQKIVPKSPTHVLTWTYVKGLVPISFQELIKSKLQNESWQRVKKFYHIYAHQHKSMILILFIGALIAGVIEIFGIIMLYHLLQVMIGGAQHMDSSNVGRFLIGLGVESKGGFIAVIGGMITATFILKNIYILCYYLYQHKVLKRWKADISLMLMEKYIHAPYSFLLAYNSSTLIRNINNIVASALNGFVLSAFNFTANVIVCMIIISILYIKYLIVTLVVAGVLITSTLLQSFFLNRKFLALGAERDNLLAEQSKSVYQGIHALKETKVIGRENYFLGAFQKVNARTVENDSRSMFLARLPSHITEITIIIAVVIISAVLLTENADNSNQSVSSLGVLAAIAFRISPLMNRTLGAIQGMAKNQASMDTLFKELNKLLHFEVYRFDRDEIVALPYTRDIEVNNVSFKYPSGKRPAVKDVSFKIKAGEMIGIVGPSGAGKTTLIDVLLGLMKPTDGEILIDGVPVTAANTKNWQKNIGYVPQSIYLNDDTIASNIAFGVAKDKIDMNRVEDALRHVQMHEFVMALEKGIDYVVGENGKKFSGGQRQRLGIARALYLDADLLIFDEATAALDVTTESQVTEAVNALRGQKTLIIIAHRLTTVYKADRIAFMHGSQLVGFGTYTELFHTNERFEHMARLAHVLPEGVLP